MGTRAQLNDVSWKRIQSVFGRQATEITPPNRPPVLNRAPAPKKITLKLRNEQLFRRENLKPRRLSYEMENQHRLESWDTDSGIAIWATTSSSLLVGDADKENRPENDDNVISKPEYEEAAKEGRLKYRFKFHREKLSLNDH